MNNPRPVAHMAGSICRLAEPGSRGGEVLVLDETDAEGRVRVLPLSAAPPAGSSVRIAAPDVEGSASPLDLHARLDRPQSVAAGALSASGSRVSPRAMADVLRALIKLDVERFARLAHAPRDFVEAKSWCRRREK